MLTVGLPLVNFRRHVVHLLEPRLPQRDKVLHDGVAKEVGLRDHPLDTLDDARDLGRGGLCPGVLKH